MKQVFLDNNEIKIIYDENDNIIFKRKPKNLIPLSIDTDGSIYNNGLGYIQGYRLNSSGGITESDISSATGFIPYKGNSIIRAYNVSSICMYEYSYFSLYDKFFNLLGSISMFKDSDGSLVNYYRGIVTEDTQFTCSIRDGVKIIPVFSDKSQIAYFRFNFFQENPNVALLTKNEKHLYDNKILTSTESNNSTIYNNGLGYKRGYRVRSAGAETEQNKAIISGYIKVQDNDIIRICSYDFNYGGVTNAINVYDSSYNCIGQFTTQPAGYGVLLNNDLGYPSLAEEKPGIWKWPIPEGKNISYIRLTAFEEDELEYFILTINEEII